MKTELLNETVWLTVLVVVKSIWLKIRKVQVMANWHTHSFGKLLVYFSIQHLFSHSALNPFKKNNQIHFRFFAQTMFGHQAIPHWNFFTSQCRGFQVINFIIVPLTTTLFHYLKIKLYGLHINPHAGTSTPSMFYIEWGWFAFWR